MTGDRPRCRSGSEEARALMQKEGRYLAYRNDEDEVRLFPIAQAGRGSAAAPPRTSASMTRASPAVTP